jgi:hypothetical protein
MQDIEDLHPLRERVLNPHLMPCFKSCLKKPKPRFKAELRKALIAELGFRLPKNEEIEKDPFLILGYGINSYLDIMMNLFWMFTIITIFCIPLCMIFS